MLSKEDNEFLTRIGPGTAMGEMVRRYWLPFYLSADLEADGPPQRVRLMGEDLIVFRATSGQVGLVGNHCPHRGASLFFGRNEEDGLRCVYHGWKYDVSGACVDMPNEPPESNFKHKIQHTAYRVQERNGMLWTYMGPEENPPELPSLEWNMVPEDHVILSMRIAENNFMQPIEGEYDSTHIGFLHQGAFRREDNQSKIPGFLDSVLRPKRGYPYPETTRVGWGDIARVFKAPRWEISNTDYGVLVGTRRDLDDGQNTYWRVYPFVMPFHTLIPAGGDDPVWSGHAWVPMDDEHTICICWTYSTTRPLNDEDFDQARFQYGGLEPLHASVDAYHPPSAKPYGRYWPKWDNNNDFNYDYAAQRSGARFSGLPGVWPQDSGMQQSMGFIYDRTKEHLGTADTGQIAIRRRMINAARALQEHGDPPPGSQDITAGSIRPVSTLLPTNDPSWMESIQERLQAGVPVKPGSLLT